MFVGSDVNARGTGLPLVALRSLAMQASIDQLGIEYMLTGSLVSSLQGEPRASHDIDIVAKLALSAAEQLVAEFPPPRYYADPDSMREAIQHGEMFNVIDVHEGEKVDVWLLTDMPFDRSRFARRQREVFEETAVVVSAPEDTILAKLRWCDLSGGSEKQYGDALRVYEVQHGELDLGYLESWVETLGVQKLWQRLLREAEPIA
jgi:hypothetical protein